MATAACRRPLQGLSPTLTLEAVQQTVTLLADLEALRDEGLVLVFSDEHGALRFAPRELP